MNFYHIVGAIFLWVKLSPSVSMASSMMPVRGNALSTTVSVATVSNNTEYLTVSNETFKPE